LSQIKNITLQALDVANPTDLVPAVAAWDWAGYAGSAMVATPGNPVGSLILQPGASAVVPAALASRLNGSEDWQVVL
jgi:hypothetical protein